MLLPPMKHLLMVKTSLVEQPEITARKKNYVHTTFLHVGNKKSSFRGLFMLRLFENLTRRFLVLIFRLLLLATKISSAMPLYTTTTINSRRFGQLENIASTLRCCKIAISEKEINVKVRLTKCVDGSAFLPPNSTKIFRGNSTIGVSF